MTKKKIDAPAVTLEQLETEIAQHDGALTDLTAARAALLNRDKVNELQALQKQHEQAIKGKDGAQAKVEKADKAVERALKALETARKKRTDAAQKLSMAELELRQVKHDIDTLQRALQID